MIYYLGLPLFLAVALLQVAAMPSLSPLGVTPNILLVFAACWAVVRGRQAMVLLPGAAFFYDLLTTGPVGISVLGLAPLMLLAVVRDQRPTETRFMPALLMVMMGTLTYHLLEGAVLAVLEYNVPWTMALTERWLPAMVANAVLTPAFYLPLWWASWDLRRPAPPVTWRS